MYKLSQINRELRKEHLPEISRAQVAYLMGNTPKKCKNPLKENIHFESEQRKKYNVYFFLDEGFRYLREWSVKKMNKSKKNS